MDEEAAESEALALRLAPAAPAGERDAAPPTVELRLLGETPPPGEAPPADGEHADEPREERP